MHFLEVTMNISEHLTPNGFEPQDLKECLTFHDSTKVKPYSSIKSFLRVGEYLDSLRGIEETSRNYRPFISEFEDLRDIDLPTMGFDALNVNRVSTRSYSKDGVFDRVTVLSALKSACDTRIGFSSLSNTAEIGFRGYPSAGGLFPIDVYVLERTANGFNLGYLNAREHRLYHVHSFVAKDRDLLSKALCDGQKDLIKNAKGVFIFTSVWERTIIKYGKQGYKFALMELGVVSHHIGMCLTAQKVATLHWGGGFDDLIGEQIGIDPRSETVGHLMWYGVADVD